MVLKKYQEQYNLSEKDIQKIEKAKENIKFNPTLLVVSIISVVLSVFSFTTLGTMNALFIITIPIALISSIALMEMYFSKKRIFVNQVKEILVTKIFETEFTHVSYLPSQGFDNGFIDDTEMYDRGNTYSSNDLLSANYKGIGFMQADVNIQNVTSNGKTTTTTTYFKGRWIVCDFIKNFDGYHQIRSNGSFFNNKKPRKFFGTKTKEIDFESVDFNKKFSCYTNDEKEAYYLITPEYMEKMTNFQEFVNCEVVYGFINNKLYIAIYNNQNAFEMSGTTISDDFINSVIYDMKLIKDVIDGLALDVDIFK